MAPFPALYILYSPPFTGCLLETSKNTQSTIHTLYDCIHEYIQKSYKWVFSMIIVFMKMPQLSNRHNFFCYFPPNLPYLRRCSQTVAQEVINVARWIPQLWRKHHNKSTLTKGGIFGQYETNREREWNLEKYRNPFPLYTPPKKTHTHSYPTL